MEPCVIDNMFVTPKVDGVVMLARDLSFLRSVSKLVMKFPTFLQKLDRTELKGCKTLDGAEGIWKIVLGRVNHVEASCILWSTRRYIEYKYLTNIYNRACNEAICDMGGCETFYSAAEDVEPVCSQSTTSHRIVFQCDYDKFSRALERKLSAVLCDASDDRVQFCFMAFDMGQSGAAKDILNSLSRTSNFPVLEVVLHYALDIHREGKSALWKRKALVESFKRSPNYEYYPMALHGLGNFYFHEELCQQAENQCVIRLIKCYSKNNAYVHKRNGGPFSKGEIAEMLLNSGYGRAPTQRVWQVEQKIRKHIKQAQLIHRLADVMSTTPYSTARVEVVVSVLEPCFNYQYDVERTVIKFLVEKDILREESLVFVNVKKMCARFKKYVVPAATEIRLHLARFLSCLRGEVFFSFSIQEMLNVAASEAVICFFIYGTAVSTREKRAHNNSLCRDLGLVTYKFRVPESGIKYNAKMFVGKCEGGVHGLDYTPMFDYSELVKARLPYQHLRIGEELQNFRRGKLKNAAVALIRLIVASANVQQKRKVNAETFTSTHYSTVKGQNIYICSSKEFTRWLMNTEHSYTRALTASHNQLFWAIKEFNKEACERALMETWITSIGNQLG